MKFTKFRGARCARCGKAHTVKAKTISGAVTKATLECNGILQTSSGPVPTSCYTGTDLGE